MVKRGVQFIEVSRSCRTGDGIPHRASPPWKKQGTGGRSDTNNANVMNELSKCHPKHQQRQRRFQTSLLGRRTREWTDQQKYNLNSVVPVKLNCLSSRVQLLCSFFFKSIEFPTSFSMLPPRGQQGKHLRVPIVFTRKHSLSSGCAFSLVDGWFSF